MENFWKYYCLNIIVNINSCSILNTNVNTPMKYCHKQTISRKWKLISGNMKYFSTMKYLAHGLLDSEILFEIL